MSDDEEVSEEDILRLTVTGRAVYMFAPTPEITALDLARIISLLKLGINAEAWRELPPDLQKHFA